MSAPSEADLGRIVNLGAPTPQNTPAVMAPISMKKPAAMPSIGEANEPTAMGKGDVQRLIATLNKSSQEPLIEMSRFSPAVQDRLRGLKAVQKEHRSLEAEFQQEVLRLEKEYFKKFCPLYAKRRDMVAGLLEPTAEEIEIGKEEEDVPTDTKGVDKAPSSIDDARGVPNFWLTVLKNRDSFASIITDRDEKALEKLVDVRLEYLETPGFRIIFDFGEPDENSFFTNAVLTKTYHYQKDLGYSGSFIYDHAEGDTISWKEGKDLTTKIEKRTQRNKTTRQTRTVSRTVPVDSFFHFFTVPTGNIADADGSFDAAVLEEELEEDYQRGEDLKEKLIPHAIDWFTGKALLYESSLEELDYDDEDFLSDEGGDHEDTEDDEDDAGKPKQEAAECKQS